MTPTQHIEQISAFAEAARELAVDAIGGVDSSTDYYLVAVQCICLQIERLTVDLDSALQHHCMQSQRDNGGYLHLSNEKSA